MCLSVGYPSAQAEKELLLGIDRREMLKQISPVMTSEMLLQAQEEVKQVFLADVVVDYLQRLVAKTRESRDYHGLSTRGMLALKRASQAYAYLGGFSEVTPEDIQAVFPAVANHRLGQAFVPFNHLGGETLNTLAHQLLRQTPVIV